MNAINSKTGAAYAMKAPEIEADHGKKTEVVFPTAEMVNPVANESNTFIVPLRRQATVVDLGDIFDEGFLVLVPEPANLNIGATVVVKFFGSADVTVYCLADPDTIPEPTDFVCDVQGDGQKPNVVALIWDGQQLVPYGLQTPTCNEWLKPKVIGEKANATVTKHDTYIYLYTNGQTQDVFLNIDTQRAQMGARVIVRFECGDTAFDLHVEASNGNGVSIQGTDNEVTVKELVWNGNGFDVLG